MVAIDDSSVWFIRLNLIFFHFEAQTSTRASLRVSEEGTASNVSFLSHAYPNLSYLE